MEISGKIIFISPVRTGVSQRTGSPWMAQDYVIETHDQFPRRCVFDLFGEDRIKQFNIQQGGEYTVSFDIDARQYQDRWFNSIRAYNVVPAKAPEVSADQNHAPSITAGDQPAASDSKDSNDDLPF